MNLICYLPGCKGKIKYISAGKLLKKNQSFYINFIAFVVKFNYRELIYSKCSNKYRDKLT